MKDRTSDHLPVPTVEQEEHAPGGSLEQLQKVSADKEKLAANIISWVLRGGVILSASIILRSEEHTSEVQSRGHLVCRLLLEKKNNTQLSKCGRSRPVCVGYSVSSPDRLARPTLPPALMY